jgi:flagellar biosynthesis protein FlhB
LLRAVMKVVLIGLVMYLLLRKAVPGFLGLPQQDLASAAATAFRPVRGVLIAFAAIVLLIAGIDVPYQLWNFRRSLRMTRQEVKQEMKESEGSPEVKARVRRLQHQLSQRRMMEDVPTADVVLVNPTHFAVALKYEAGTAKAPKIVAKGLDEVALVIRKLADAHDVPVVESPPLARALYRQAQVGQEIPVALYAAVAQILGYVYQLRTWRRDGGRAPLQPSVDVPSSLSDPDGVS